MTARERNALRKKIEQHKFLFIIDEASNDESFAVHDRRGGRNLGTAISRADSLEYLVTHGAEAWLEKSAHNGMGLNA
jgi:hypothetical protein